MLMPQIVIDMLLFTHPLFSGKLPSRITVRRRTRWRWHDGI